MCRLHGKKGFMEEVYHFTSDKGYLKPRCLPSGVYRQGQVGGFPKFGPSLCKLLWSATIFGQKMGGVEKRTLKHVKGSGKHVF